MSNGNRTAGVMGKRAAACVFFVVSLALIVRLPVAQAVNEGSPIASIGVGVLTPDGFQIYTVTLSEIRQGFQRLDPVEPTLIGSLRSKEFGFEVFLSDRQGTYQQSGEFLTVRLVEDSFLRGVLFARLHLWDGTLLTFDSVANSWIPTTAAEIGLAAFAGEGANSEMRLFDKVTLKLPSDQYLVSAAANTNAAQSSRRGDLQVSAAEMWFSLPEQFRLATWAVLPAVNENPGLLLLLGEQMPEVLLATYGSPYLQHVSVPKAQEVLTGRFLPNGSRQFLLIPENRSDWTVIESTGVSHAFSMPDVLDGEMTFLAGNFDQDPQDEVIGISETGVWFQFDFTSSEVAVHGTGAYPIPSSLQARPVDLDSDGKTEVLFLNRGSKFVLMIPAEKNLVRFVEIPSGPPNNSLLPTGSIRFIASPEHIRGPLIPVQFGNRIMYLDLFHQYAANVSPRTSVPAMWDSGFRIFGEKGKQVFAANTGEDQAVALLWRSSQGAAWELAVGAAMPTYQRFRVGAVQPSDGELLALAHLNPSSLLDLVLLDRGNRTVRLAVARSNPAVQTVSERQQYACVGFRPFELNGWKPLWAGRCPGNHIVTSLDEGGGSEGYSAIPMTCCPLPTNDILLPWTERIGTRCAEGEVVTGQVVAGSGVNPVSRLRCTKVNLERYQLGVRKVARYWGLGHSQGGQSTGLQHEDIASFWRYSVGRVYFDRWATDGCIGDPMGSALVAIGFDDCVDHWFQEIQYRGIDGDPPAGTSVFTKEFTSAIPQRFLPLQALPRGN